MVATRTVVRSHTQRRFASGDAAWAPNTESCRDLGRDHVLRQPSGDHTVLVLATKAVISSHNQRRCLAVMLLGVQLPKVAESFLAILFFVYLLHAIVFRNDRR